MFGNKDEEILHELRAVHGAIQQVGVCMSLDFSKLQAAVNEAASDVQTLTTTVSGESVKIQSAIDALANAVGSDPANQAIIDQATATLAGSNATLVSTVAAVQALPTTPTSAPSA